MALFGKKVHKAEVPCCGGAAGEPAGPEEENASVKVLGGGCKKCNQLEEAAKAALAELGMDTTVGHVRDYAQIASYGVMSTPALVVDGKVVSSGKVLSQEEVAAILKEARQVS